MAYGIEKLRSKLNKKKVRVRIRYDYYEIKNAVHDLGISTPPSLRGWQTALGWCASAVDQLADRLSFREFTNDNFNMQSIFDMNNPDILFDSAFRSALISSCCFNYISVDEAGTPRMQIIDGSRATGEMDPITGLLREGYAVLDVDKWGEPTLEAYFLPGETWIYAKGEAPRVIRNAAPYPLLVPIINRPDAKRPFGHSQISRSMMKHTQSALRTIKRSEIAAEFYSYPQRYILGLDPDAEFDEFEEAAEEEEAEAVWTENDRWRMTMSSMLNLSRGKDGEAPTVGQFAQQSMAPHTEQLKMFASLFAGEAGMTLDDMGFPSDNPSSAEAIKSAHESLRLKAKKAQAYFSTGIINSGYIAACVRDGRAYKREEVYKTGARWYPIFEPDAASLSGLGDALLKISQATGEPVSRELFEDLTGLSL